MTKESLIERVQEIDVSIDKIMIEKCKELIANDDALQKTLEESNLDLEQEICRYASLKKVGQGPKVTVKDYLQKYPEILQKHARRIEERWGLRWTEYSRKNSYFEEIFLQNSREIYGGRFGEIFQTVLVLNKGQIKKYLAYSGRTDGVGHEDIDKSIPNKEIKSLQEDSEMAVLLHNHPNLLRDSVVRSIRNGPTIGFISNGSLSRKDVKLADKLYFEKFNKRVPVVMLAINEIGLTHMYIAGTSETYKF